MNVISPKEDMYADFFQINRYSNASGTSLSEMAKRNPVFGFSYRAVIDNLKKKYGINIEQIDSIYAEYLDGGNRPNDLASFTRYVQAYMAKPVQENIVNEENILGIQPPSVMSPDIATSEELKKPKKDLPLLWIGVGALVLIGGAILIFKK